MTEILQQLEDERCLLFPLFLTSYVLLDYFIDNDYFGAEQLVIGSMSSKTGLGLACLVHQAPSRPRVISITSESNRDFVMSLGCCDELIHYGNESEIDATLTSAYVDMSEMARSPTHCIVTTDKLVESCMVGATHWETARRGSDLPGARPTFFFAPGQIAKRDEEWGAGVLFAKASEASVKLAAQVKDQIRIERLTGAEAASQIWKDMLDYRVAPSRGIIVSL